MLHASSRRRLASLVLLAVISATLLPDWSSRALAAQGAAPRPASAAGSSLDGLAWLWQALSRFWGGGELSAHPSDGTCGDPPPNYQAPSPNVGTSLDPNG